MSLFKTVSTVENTAVILPTKANCSSSDTRLDVAAQTRIKPLHVKMLDYDRLCMTQEIQMFRDTAVAIDNPCLPMGCGNLGPTTKRHSSEHDFCTSKSQKLDSDYGIELHGVSTSCSTLKLEEDIDLADSTDGAALEESREVGEFIRDLDNILMSSKLSSDHQPEENIAEMPYDDLMIEIDDIQVSDYYGPSAMEQSTHTTEEEKINHIQSYLLRGAPSTQYSGARYQAQWFKNYSWLHYDESKDRAFCFVCMVAAKEGKITNAKVDQGFISTGYNLHLK